MRKFFRRVAHGVDLREPDLLDGTPVSRGPAPVNRVDEPANVAGRARIGIALRQHLLGKKSHEPRLWAVYGSRFTNSIRAKFPYPRDAWQTVPRPVVAEKRAGNLEERRHWAVLSLPNTGGNGAEPGRFTAKRPLSALRYRLGGGDGVPQITVPNRSEPSTIAAIFRHKSRYAATAPSARVPLRSHKTSLLSGNGYGNGRFGGCQGSSATL